MLTENEVKAIVKDTVEEVLLQIGVDTTNPMKMQQDFQHLREWRETTQAIQSKGILALVGMVVSGVVAGVWMAIKDHIK